MLEGFQHGMFLNWSGWDLVFATYINFRLYAVSAGIATPSLMGSRLSMIEYAAKVFNTMRLSPVAHPLCMFCPV